MTLQGNSFDFSVVLVAKSKLTRTTIIFKILAKCQAFCQNIIIVMINIFSLFFQPLVDILLTAEIHRLSNPFPKHLKKLFILLQNFPISMGNLTTFPTYSYKAQFLDLCHDYTFLEEQFVPTTRFFLLPATPISHLTDVLYFADICLRM